MATWYFDHGQALDICPLLVIEGPPDMYVAQYLLMR